MVTIADVGHASKLERSGVFVSSALSTNQGLQAEYESRVAADLRQNSEEHERVTDQLAALQTQLETLERDRRLLLTMQHAVASTDNQAGPPSHEPVLKNARQPADQAPPLAQALPTVPPSRAEEVADGAHSTPHGRESGAENGGRQPKVTDLAQAQLVRHGNPQSAAEVAAAVSTKERPISIISVRTALEGLVRRSAAYRSRQGRAVYYQAANGDSKAADDKVRTS